MFLYLTKQDRTSAFVAVTDSIMENKNAILYYRDTFSQWFISPITIGGKEYQRYKNNYVSYPLLYRECKIFSQLFPDIFLFYEEGDDYTPARAGICRLK